MEQLIHSFIKSDFITINKIINDPNLISKEDTINTVIYFLGLLKLDLVEDEDVYVLIGICLENRLKLADFKYEYKTVLQIKNKLLTYSFLSSIIELYEWEMKTASVLKKFNPHKLSLVDFEFYVQYQFATIIKSYSDTNFLITLQQPMNKHTKENVILEIVNRCRSLIKLFGIKLLKFFDVPIIKLSEFYTFTDDNKIQFYIQVVTKLNTSLRVLQKLLNQHVMAKTKYEAFMKNYYDLKQKKLIN